MVITQPLWLADTSCCCIDRTSRILSATDAPELTKDVATIDDGFRQKLGPRRVSSLDFLPAGFLSAVLDLLSKRDKAALRGTCRLLRRLVNNSVTKLHLPDICKTYTQSTTRSAMRHITQLALKGFAFVQQLQLEDSPALDSKLLARVLQGLGGSRLTSLDVAQCTHLQGDCMITLLQGLANLQSLGIAYGLQSATGCPEAVSKLTKLTQLVVAGAPPKDEAEASILAAVSTLSSLRSLHLSQAQLQTPNLTRLSALTALQELRGVDEYGYSWCSVEVSLSAPSGAAVLVRQFPLLRHLALVCTKPMAGSCTWSSESTLQCLTALQSLAQVQLVKGYLLADGPTWLARLPALRSLTLSEVSIQQPSWFQLLGGLPRLSHLVLDDCGGPAWGFGLTALGACTALTALEFLLITQAATEPARWLASLRPEDAPPALAKLSFTGRQSKLAGLVDPSAVGSTAAAAAGGCPLVALGLLPSLTALHMSGPGMRLGTASALLPALAPLAERLRHLTLDFSSFSGVAFGLAVRPELLPQLRQLKLSCLSLLDVSLASVVAALSSLPHLSSLDLGLASVCGTPEPLSLLLPLTCLRRLELRCSRRYAVMVLPGAAALTKIRSLREVVLSASTERCGGLVARAAAALAAAGIAVHATVTPAT